MRFQEIELHNFRGTAEQPILFVNSGGIVVIHADGEYAGIEIYDSEHLRVTGTGVSDRCGAEYPVTEQACGIVVHGGDKGVAAVDRTRHVEIDHIEVTNADDAGIFARTDSGAAVRGGWTQYGTYVHHNYVHDVRKEGAYIGGSDYLDGDAPVLVGVEVNHNLVVNSGWDGLQVGSAVQDCRIHHNIVIRSGWNTISSAQDSNIVNNWGSVCDIYNNFLAEAHDQGMYIQGSGGNRIYNNVIVRAGQGGGGDGIVVSDSGGGESVFIWNNTIVDPGNHGVNINYDGRDSANQIHNNLIVGAEKAPFDDEEEFDTSANLSFQSVEDAGFVDPEQDDFALLPGSPAIDAGIDLTAARIHADYRGVTRPQGEAFDVGAFEFHSALSGVLPARENPAFAMTDDNSLLAISSTDR
jgi:hypothetical protein